MRKSKKRTLLFIVSLKAIAFISLILFAACMREKEIDMEGFYTEKPVVYSIISPGEDIHIYISKTLPFHFSVEKIPVVHDAKVLLFGNDTSIEVPFNNEREHYFIPKESFPVLTGKKYILNIVMSNGLESMSTTTVPQTNPVWVSIGQKIINRNSGDESSKLIEFSFAWKNDCVENCSYYVFSNEIFQRTANGNYYIFPDETYQGDVLRAIYTDVYDNFRTIHHAKISLIKASPEMKRFTDYEEQLRLINDQLDMGLFWELYRGVIPEYTNINGGYGFFGSYLKSDTTINIRSMY
ncbi:MAG: DUF4249 family protein [Mariniphaga sp.]